MFQGEATVRMADLGGGRGRRPPATRPPAKMFAKIDGTCEKIDNLLASLRERPGGQLIFGGGIAKDSQ